MRRIVIGVLFALTLGTNARANSALQDMPAASADASRPAVTVTRDGGFWTAEYELDRDAPVWAFFRSALTAGTRRPWRPEQWRVETPGVLLERVGTRDILRAADGGPVPRRVRIAFTPRGDNLEADYGTLTFTDGSVALPSGQFDVFPLESVAEAGVVPSDLNGYALRTGPAEVTWRDRAGPILFRGNRVPEATAVQAETYVLFGAADMVEGERLVTVTDPQLPGWISAAITDFAPRVADVYASRLGPGQSDRPTIMVSWVGPTPGRTSMAGSVMPGLIVMNFDGVGIVDPSAAVLAMTRWFIGHESAHFWLGQIVRYELARDAWLIEGGADLMAIRALQAVVPAYDARAELQKSVDDCLALADEPVAAAAERGEHRAHYACGAVFALVAEGVQRRSTGGDWFDVLRPLLEASRADGVLTRDEWLDALDAASGDPSLRQDIKTLLDQGAPDPAVLIGRLFDHAGVGYRWLDGRIRLD